MISGVTGKVIVGSVVPLVGKPGGGGGAPPELAAYDGFDSLSDGDYGSLTPEFGAVTSYIMDISIPEAFDHFESYAAGNHSTLSGGTVRGGATIVSQYTLEYAP